MEHKWDDGGTADKKQPIPCGGEHNVNSTAATMSAVHPASLHLQYVKQAFCEQSHWATGAPHEIQFDHFDINSYKATCDALIDEGVYLWQMLWGTDVSTESRLLVVWTWTQVCSCVCVRGLQGTQCTHKCCQWVEVHPQTLKQHF